jgi:hypothetical protein
MVNLSVDAVAQQDDSAKDVSRQGRPLTYLLEAREEYGFELISNQVLSPRTFSSAPALVEYMSVRDVAVAHGLRYPVGDGYSSDGQPCFEGTVDRLLAMRREGYGMLSSVGYLDAVRRRLRGEEEWECDAGRSFFVIDVDGRVGICDRHRLREMTFEQLTTANYKLLAEDGRAQKEAEECHRECLVNCAYETSYSSYKFRYLADQVLGKPTER